MPTPTMFRKTESFSCTRKVSKKDYVFFHTRKETDKELEEHNDIPDDDIIYY